MVFKIMATVGVSVLYLDSLCESQWNNDLAKVLCFVAALLGIWGA